MAMGMFRLPSTGGRVVTVLGAGVLGRRIACAWAAGGHSAIVYDPSPEQRTTAVQYCDTNMDRYSNRAPRGTVKAINDLAQAVEKSWLVIECVPEKLPLKVSTFAQLERLTAKDTILCTNSSSYKSREMLGDLQESTKQRVLNMHYYMPPSNRIVELMTDGFTDESIFPFLVEKLNAIDMSPFVARKESTGLIFNRLWAAIKREVLYILAEQVSTPEEIDKLWVQTWTGNFRGPVAMMDAVGLDTVSFIEQHYISERNLPDTAVRFLKDYIEQGKLGSKSAKGGLLPPSPVQGTANADDSIAEAPPTLFFLDMGISTSSLADVFRSGRVMVGSEDARLMQPLAEEQSLPDGIDISLSAGRLFWTCMGSFSENNGAVYSSNLDGSKVEMLVAPGSVHTPKQIAVDDRNSKLYFADREGMRIFRCNFDGSHLEVIAKTGDWKDAEQVADQTRWCVGVAVSPSSGKFYWTQKGPPKGNKGRIFQANMELAPGETAETRIDIELLFQSLPESIDLEVDEAAGSLYWTDRGELPIGNSINRARLDDVKPIKGGGGGGGGKASVPGRDYELLVRGLNEAIGIKLDTKNGRMYATDLGGTVYRFNLDGGDKTKLYEGCGALGGITLAHV